ncbi:MULTISPECIES: VUT family protein [Pseudomonadota]|uniref:VUT family protein n=1 Tax=Pseudomonadota TaxID=1224 RepID=UPI001CBDCAB3|nr:VUT family protein [Phyllobacterium calauticae]MBZ3693361.1 VUT family protein [Phyllobacterium calauticae]
MPLSRAYSLSDFIFPVLTMCAVVAASNILVQYPFNHLGLGEILTYGAFTYPVAFLVNDLSNRRFGPQFARKVVYAGFVIAVILSVWLATPRIAIASGSAFLCAQLLDVTVFSKLRQLTWWKAPFASAVFGSLLDTLLFFSIAFAAQFAWIDLAMGRADSSLAMLVPFLGKDIPLWMSLGFGDLMVKIVMAVVMLVPYGAILAVFAPAIYSANRNSR